MNTYLSVVLPAYKDEISIQKIIKDLLFYIKPAVEKLEIIIVEDGSPDNTPVVCDKLQADFPEVRVIHHRTNLGYGTTLRDGFSASRGNIIFYTDGDNQYDIKELLIALNTLNDTNAGALLGYRFPRTDGFTRILVSKIYNIIFRLFFHVKVKDVNCSFKLFRAETLHGLCLESKSAFIDAEIVYKLIKKNTKITAMPVTNFPNELRRTNFLNIGLIMEMVNEMAKQRISFK